MIFNIKKSFSKDIDKIRDKKILASILEIIDQIEGSSSMKENKNLKKIEGSKNHYRIRIGDYRFGLYLENETVFIVRVLHRKEIYRFSQ